MLFFLTQGRKTDDLNKSVVLYSFLEKSLLCQLFLYVEGGGVFTQRTQIEQDRLKRIFVNENPSVYKCLISRVTEYKL